MKIMSILDKGGAYLKGEIYKRNLRTQTELIQIEHDVVNSQYEYNLMIDEDNNQNW